MRRVPGALCRGPAEGGLWKQSGPQEKHPRLLAWQRTSSCVSSLIRFARARTGASARRSRRTVSRRCFRARSTAQLCLLRSQHALNRSTTDSRNGSSTGYKRSAKPYFESTSTLPHRRLKVSRTRPPGSEHSEARSDFLSDVPNRSEGRRVGTV